MVYEIDQSGKIENTSVPSILAFSNSKNNYIYIKPSDKRQVKKHFLSKGKQKIYIYTTFACLLYFLIKKNRLNGLLVVDVEYPGNMSLIKSYLFRIFKKYKFNAERVDVYFKLVGKKSKAHELAIDVFRKRKGTLKNTVSMKEVLEVLKGV